jgi:hypothetical protein
MKRPLVVLCTVVVTGGVVAGPAGASLPSLAAKVAVAAAQNVTGIEGHIHRAASVEGTVTFGGAAAIASVTAFYGNTAVGFGSSDYYGHYRIGGLAASSTGYAICVSGAAVFSVVVSPTGYLGRCYKTATWGGGSVPSSATKVPLTTTQHKTGINVALQAAARITGKVTSPGGTGLSSVRVIARNRSSGRTSYGYTSGSGTYSIDSLTASSTGYTVCFNPQLNIQGTTGYRPRCYKNVTWSGGSTLPSTATAVSVSLGHTHSGVSQSLTVGGAISGTVTATDTTPVQNATIVVYSSAGVRLATTTTDSLGKYVVKGLAAASGDRVCVSPDNVPQLTYVGQCWNNVAWNGGALPSGTTGVSVTTGQVHTAIDFSLTIVMVGLSTISGNITEGAGNNALQGATVQLFSISGSSLRTTTTDAAGAYAFTGLTASATGYVVCANATGASSTTATPATGWALGCYNDVAWNGLDVPSAAARLIFAAGHGPANIDIALQVGGEISGKVTRYAETTTINGVTVKLYTAAGRSLAFTTTASGGTYAFVGLSPVAAASGYIVCFDGRSIPSSYGYRPQCYSNVGWNGTA